MLKKISSFLIVAVMVLSMLTPIMATETVGGQCGDNLSWTLDDSGTLTISGTGKMKNWSYGGTPWDDYNSFIKKVIINYGVTSIGDRVFDSCKSLTSISIPNSVTSIGNGAFRDCESLTSVSIPNSVTSIGERAFYECDKLTSVSIPSGVTSIRNYAFYYCESLTSISIPSGVTSIGDYAFGYCKSLTSVSIPSGVTSIGNHAFAHCDNLTSVSISSGVTSIGGDAFSLCKSLTSIVIPDSVTSIGSGAFYYCESLKSIVIPDSVTSIGHGVFSCCDSLTDIYYCGGQLKWIPLGKSAGVPSGIKIHYNYVAPGTVIGSALRTDITAEINGHAIPSFNVDGYTYIVAEDLKDYGFSVYYDNAARTLGLNRDNTKTAVTRYYVKPYVAKWEVGIKEYDLVATDIVTYLDNNYVQSYNINGLTIIPFNELGRYGAVSFDEGSRTIRAIIPGLN